MTDASGAFSVELDAGRYFVYVVPAAGDDRHLPGGSLARQSVELAPGSTTDLDINLSEMPPPGAAYVGSSTCIGCHPGFQSVAQTLHSLGLRRLTAAGPVLSSLQDLQIYPGADRGLAFFADGNPDDNTGPGDGIGHRIAAGSYNILLGLDGTGHFQATESLDGARTSARLYIEFTYGGEGRFKQLYATRLDSAGAWTADPTQGSYHLLPGQFSETRGDTGRAREVTVPGWTTYSPERWDAPAVDGGLPAITPAPVESFDAQCAGCHFTGMSLTRNVDGLFQAHAVADPGGPFDYDGDGSSDEMNIGCERCHGPGSQHAANAGGYIVEPQYLAPGRANLVCGQCHMRGQGNGTIAGEGQGDYPSRNEPLSGAIEFPGPGISAAEFFGTADGTGIPPDFGTQGGFFDTVDLASDPVSSWLDATGGFGSRFDHSKRNVQHYMDHVRSAHSQNPFRMLVCWDCHTVHESGAAGQLIEPADNNVICLRCHAGEGGFSAVDQAMVDAVASGANAPPELRSSTNDHVIQRTFDLIGVAMNLGAAAYANPGGADALGRCTVCHMPATAKSGSWIEDDQGFRIRGDISSHTFDNVSPDTAEGMALAGLEPVPNSCVPCHRGLVRGSWPDYRFREP